MNAHLIAVIALCDAARLVVLRIERHDGQIAAYVAPLPVTPETLIRRLKKAMNAPYPYSLGYNVRAADGAVSLWFTPGKETA